MLGKLLDRLSDKGSDCMSGKMSTYLSGFMSDRFRMIQIDCQLVGITRRLEESYPWFIMVAVPKVDCQDSRWASDESNEVRGSDHGKARDSHFDLYEVDGIFGWVFFRKYPIGMHKLWRPASGKRCFPFVPHGSIRWRRFSKREVGSWKT